MAIVKEYYEEKIETRRNLKPQEHSVGKTSIIRFDDNAPLTTNRLSQLFNVAAKDFPNLSADLVTISKSGLEIQASPKSTSYKKLPPKIFGAQG